MRHSTGHRRRQSGITHVVFAMLAVVWLNMVCQPCAMAFELDSADTGDRHECPYCPDEDDAHCEDPAPARCAFFDSVDYDGRAAALPTTGSQLAFMAPDPGPPPAPAAPGAPGAPRVATHGLGPPLPLHLLYCVFLN